MRKLFGGAALLMCIQDDGTGGQIDRIYPTRMLVLIDRIYPTRMLTPMLAPMLTPILTPTNRDIETGCWSWLMGFIRSDCWFIRY
jgi:hypothetical protein